MCARSPLLRAAFALVWLVGTVPQLAQADYCDVVPFPSVVASAPAAEVKTCEVFKLNLCAELPIPAATKPGPVTLCSEANPSVPAQLGTPTRPGDVDPHITSVPVAALVGGTLIASMGIVQRVRRVRSIRG